MNPIKKTYAMALMTMSRLLGVDTAKKFDTKLRFHRTLNLKQPKSLADKLSYIELHEQSQLASKCTDKWEVRKYIADKGLAHILVPVIGGAWYSFEEINFDSFPKSYVLKATHGCKMNYIVKDKDQFNFEDCKKAVNDWLSITYGTYSMEPHYATIPHRVYAEKYLGDMSKLIDYKFHCLNGEPQFVLTVSDRKVIPNKPMQVKLNMFDLGWNRLDGVVGFKNETAGNGNIPKPKHFEEMVDIARALSRDFKFVRVDLYDTSDGVMFGELTFSPACCVFPYLSEEFLLEMGSLLKLN